MIDFEDWLRNEFEKTWHGPSDLAIDAFDMWIDNLSVDQWLLYGQRFKYEKLSSNCNGVGKIDEVEVNMNEVKLFNFLQHNHNEFTSGDGSYPMWDIIAKAIAKKIPSLLEIKK